MVAPAQEVEIDLCLPRSSDDRNHGPLDNFNKNNNSFPEDVEISRPGSSQPRLSSSQSTSNLPTREDAAKANARIQSEVTILKNSIELPAIDSGKPDARAPSKMIDQFKSACAALVVEVM